MSEKKCSANVIQGVYTSAKKLLTGGTGYGYVARSETFCDIEKFTSKLVGYSLEEKLGKKLELDGKNGERFILKPFDNKIANKIEKYLSFTRVSESTSAAFLGRSTVIAHHLVVKTVDLKNIKMDASDLVAWAGGLPGYDPKFEFLKGWDKDPQELKPISFKRMGLNTLSLDKLLENMGGDDNQQKNLKDALLWVANRLIDLENTKKTVIIIIPYDWQKHVPRLLVIILRLLPNGIQNSLVAVSQVWDTGGLNFDAGLIFTYPDAPYLETMKLSHIKNKVELFDLTKLATISETLTRIDKDCKQYVLEYWNATNPRDLNFLQVIFNNLDPTCKRKDDVLNVKLAFDRLMAKVPDENLSILKKLEVGIKNLLVFQSGDSVTKKLLDYLEKFVFVGVEKVRNKQGYEALFEIWDLVEQNDLKLNPNEMAKVLKTTDEAISENYIDILELALPTFAVACISPKRNLKIIKIVKDKGIVPDSLLAAIEIEWLNSRGVFENTTKKNETSNIVKDLLDLASDWFDKLGSKIIKPAWDRIKKSDGAKNHPCDFSKAIVDKFMNEVKQAKDPEKLSRESDKSQKVGSGSKTGGIGSKDKILFKIWMFIKKLVLSPFSSSAGSGKATGENNKQGSWKTSESKTEFKISGLGRDGLRKEDYNELIRAFNDLVEKDSILSKLKTFIKKLKVFENTELRKGILREQLNKALKKVIEYENNEERCKALFEIWDLIEENMSELNEIDDALKVPLKAISHNYEVILKEALPALAKACISLKQNLKIIEIMKDKGVVPDSLLNAMEKEFLNSPKENEELPNNVVSNWFNLGPKIIVPAWNRIKEVGGEKDHPCAFSKTIVNLQVQNYCGHQIEQIDDDQQPSSPQQ